MRTYFLLLASFPLAQTAELHQAVRDCRTDRVAQLLSKHPALNELDDSGRTPLNVAIESLQPACVRLLLEAGADPKTHDARGRTSFDAARAVANLDDKAAVEKWRAI